MDKERGSFMGPRSGRRRLLAGVVSVTLLAAASTRLAYADTDLKGRITAWADKQTTAAITELKAAIQTEQETQRLRLQEQLQAGLDRQTAEFAAFTAEQKARYIEQLRLHADGLIKRQSEGEGPAEERARVQATLELILGQATEAMNRLDVSYNPAVNVPPVEHPAVTDNVYQAVYSPTAIRQ